MGMFRRAGDPDDPNQAKAWVAGTGVALSILSLGLLVWMAVDVDGDGRSSFSEFRDGTSPMNGDTDGDGVADGWELDHGYDALSASSAPDVDAPETSDPGVGDVTECSIGGLLDQECQDDGASDNDSPSQAPSAEAEIPPSGGKGAGGTSIIGVVTTLVASVAGRVIAVRVLHS